MGNFSTHGFALLCLIIGALGTKLEGKISPVHDVIAEEETSVESHLTSSIGSAKDKVRSDEPKDKQVHSNLEEPPRRQAVSLQDRGGLHLDASNQDGVRLTNSSTSQPSTSPAYKTPRPINRSEHANVIKDAFSVKAVRDQLQIENVNASFNMLYHKVATKDREWAFEFPATVNEVRVTMLHNCI